MYYSLYIVNIISITVGVHRIVVFTIRPDAGYFRVQDSVFFFRLNCLKSGVGYCIVTIFEISLFEKYIHTVRKPQSTQTYDFKFRAPFCLWKLRGFLRRKYWFARDTQKHGVLDNRQRFSCAFSHIFWKTNYLASGRIINNYWMRLSMISRIIHTEVNVICNVDRRLDNSWYHA